MNDDLSATDVLRWFASRAFILFSILAMLTLFSNVTYAEPLAGSDEESAISDDANGKEDSGPKSICPVTLIKDNDLCFKCHNMMYGKDGKAKFGIKELPLDAAYDDCPYGMSIVKDADGNLRPYMILGEIAPPTETVMREVGFYLYRHPELHNLIIELQSPGGSVFSAWRMVGVMEEMRSHGIKIETRCYGFAASAAFVILVAGDQGSRVANKNAELMTHKLWSFRMFSIDDPDTTADKAALMKHFQDNINSYILRRTKLTQEIIDEKTFKRDWWMTAGEALEYGIVDKIIE